MAIYINKVIKPQTQFGVIRVLFLRRKNKKKKREGGEGKE